MTAHNTRTGCCSECRAVLSRDAYEGGYCGACGVPVRVWIPPADIEARIAAAMAAAEEDDDERDE